MTMKIRKMRKIKKLQIYWQSPFKGKLIFKNIVDYFYESENNSCVLFSQGMDSTNTVISHLDENLLLITLHGSDILSGDVEGFNILSRKVIKFEIK